MASAAGPQAAVTAIVTAFDSDVGLGTITTDSGHSYGFHCTAIADGSRTIEVGTAVVAAIGPAGPGRWEARSLTPRRGSAV